MYTLVQYLSKSTYVVSLHHIAEVVGVQYALSGVVLTLTLLILPTANTTPLHGDEKVTVVSKVTGILCHKRIQWKPTLKAG